MKALAIAAFLLCPVVAEAHHTCDETTTVVGEQQCSRFGSGWSGVSLAWDFGLAFRAFRYDAIDREVDTPDGRVHATSAATPGTSTDFAFRAVYNLLDHFHLVTELSLGRLGNVPQLSTSPVARSMSPTPSASFDEHGWTIGGLLGAGVHAAHSGVTVGAEVLGVMPHMILFKTAQLPDTYFGQGGVAVEARVLAAIWISPHWTLGGLVSTNTLARDEHTVMLSIGLHAFPYDGGR